MGIMYDSTMPHHIPGGAVACLYINGNWKASATDASRFSRVLWIDVNGEDPSQASILDIENGDATPGHVPAWCQARVNAVPGTLLRLYCNISTWPEVKAAVRSMGTDLRGRVRYWIANPTGVAHLVPGSSATQYFWGQNYDESEYSQHFFTVA